MNYSVLLEFPASITKYPNMTNVVFRHFFSGGEKMELELNEQDRKSLYEAMLQQKKTALINLHLSELALRWLMSIEKTEKKEQ